MKILCLGDVYGEPGYQAILERLPTIRQELGLDFVLINAENAADGHGLRPDQADGLLAAGADALTLGNHAWDHKPIRDYIWKQPALVRPLNFDPNAPGRGKALIRTSAGKRVQVIQVQGKIFMRKVGTPYSYLRQGIEGLTLGEDVDAILIDVHAECASEKQICGHMMDGKVTAVFGTHTHVATADAQILPQGTAYQTDLGMTGVQGSVIGWDVKTALARFVEGDKKTQLEPAQGKAQLKGLLIETDDTTGLALKAEPYSG